MKLSDLKDPRDRHHAEREESGAYRKRLANETAKPVAQERPWWYGRGEERSASSGVHVSAWRI
jgi:hypothetical protein